MRTRFTVETLRLCSQSRRRLGKLPPPLLPLWETRARRRSGEGCHHAGQADLAAPGLAGAAAITSALAAFGPGGMLGGLLTAGALLSAGSGGIAAGLASMDTSPEALEVVVKAQLDAAILRRFQGMEQTSGTWDLLVETAAELRRERLRLGALSDEKAPSLKALDRKLESIDRALAYLAEKRTDPLGD